MFTPKRFSPKRCTPERLVLSLYLALAVTASAQEPERKPETAPAAPTPSQGTQTVQEPERNQEAQPKEPQGPPQKSAKPAPERKGGIQNAEATKASEKGSITNLGTDVAAVRQRIEAALNSDPTLKGTVFNLNVTEDTIEISGVANHGRDRTAARRIVQSFAGNMRVKDRITVAGSAPPSATPPTTDSTDKPKTQTEVDADALAKPESDEQRAAQKKANKPKKVPAKHGDQSEEPRR